MSPRIHVFISLCLLSPVFWSRQLPADEAEVLSQLQDSLKNYSTAATWKNRRAELRREFLKGAGLWPLPPRSRPNVIRHSLREHSGYTVENVAIETLPGFYCTGNLYRPVGRKELQPAILCPHGHFQPLGRFRENHQIRCAHLATMGATVFSYSMVGWQDSQQTTHNDPQVLALQTWNSICAVDFLCGLERVDPGRVGITGASGGGTQTFFLALIDDRIRASAPLVIVYPWTAPDGCLCEGGLPVMQEARTNAIELAAATAPRPQLLISVGNDPTETFPQTGFPFIRRMYEVAGAADAVSNVHFADEGHDFGPSKRREVYRFFAEHLQIVPGPFYAGAADLPKVPPEDLSQITIETPEQLTVFSSTHPRPAHALQGSADIAAALERHLDDLRRQQEQSSTAVRVEECPAADYSFRAAGDADEMLMFTAPGFDHVGEPRSAAGTNTARLEITVRDATSGQPTPCRINVVGPDGHFYEPTEHPLKLFSLTGAWPKSGWGNRQGKAPIRYFGRFFYSAGQSTVVAPSGTIRVEVWRGFEYRPLSCTVHVSPGTSTAVELTLEHTIPAGVFGYYSGDPHIHIHRRNQTDEARILDLMQAEDIRYSTTLAYNEPAGPYAGFMKRMESPQSTGVGQQSIVSRDGYAILSGQEYRSRYYGHINFFLTDQLVFDGEAHNADDWPPFGLVAERVREAGGIAFYAHGGYAQEIYADVAQGNVDGVELLQFGVYRGIGLNDWYHMLNAGFRVPASGACDYPACRRLGDCRTYVSAEDPPTMEQWLRGMSEGRSFITSGPVLLLEVDGHRPGDQLDRSGSGPHLLTAKVRVRSDVAPVTNVQLIGNGRILREMIVPRQTGKGSWLEFEQTVACDASTWIAARAFSLSPTGTPDAESHTNPVYVVVDDKMPYSQDSLDVLVRAVDGQIAVHKQREFAERARVIAYFERSRDILMKIRDDGGASASGHPSDAVAVSGLSDPGQLHHTEDELREFLKPVPPRSIDEALSSFDTIDGFEMQLVAHEPLVVDPIAASFDAHGDLYVCEMRDYPYKPTDGEAPIGTVRLLRDTDGDGDFDESHVFADQLLWASGVAPWKDGVFVAAAPDIWYLKDTNGDHQADVRERIYTGFGTGNQQAMLNNLTWGLDHKIYGSTAHNGGLISTVGGPAKGADPVSVTGHDFRFDPVTGRLEAITGTVQFGNTFDDWGNRFLCSESRPLLHAMLPQHYLARNPYLPVPSAIRNLTDGPVPIFRISPLERWRIIRSSRRVAAGGRSPHAAGASHHVMDAAAGVTIYRGAAFPAELRGNVFIGGAQNNLIHRRTLTADGLTFRSARADENTEFVRSSDNWFRPVNFVNAPDGTLYVLDMYREILESIHVPDDVVKHLDLTSGRSHGRIYRIAPIGFESSATPRLDEASTNQLVAALESPHGWWRDTAQRLLFERQDRAAVPALRKTLTTSSFPQARLHALRSLAGLQAMTDADLLQALGDAHPGIREHALQLAEPRLDHSPPLLDATIAHADHPQERLRVQAAFSLGESQDPRAAAALVNLAGSSTEQQHLRTAVLSSVGRQPLPLFRSLVRHAEDADLLRQLAAMIGSQGQYDEINAALETLSTLPDATQQTDLLLKLGLALRDQGHVLTFDERSTAAADSLLSTQLHSARTVSVNPEAEVANRQRAIALLGCTTLDFSGATLQDLLRVEQPEAIQLAAVDALAGYRDPQITDWFIGGWSQQTPTVRKRVVTSLLARPQWTQSLLEAAVNGAAGVAQIDSTRRSLLLTHSDEQIRALAQQLFAETGSTERSAILASYQSAIASTGRSQAGQQVFRRECAACHQLENVGHAIGPNLASSPARDPAAMLNHILDPNRYVLPNYETYVVVDTSGRIFTGMIAEQTATSLTLRRAENQSDTILRTNIDELAGTGQSLMPEGLEKKITVQEMSDLLAYLQSVKQPGDNAALPVGTLPGLIEPARNSLSEK